MHEQNRQSWNAVTPAHNRKKIGQSEFFSKGGDTLFPEELALLGSLDGVRLLHMQCNCGQDTLSLARRGARVTGVDICDEAIAFARQLAAESGIPAEFHRSDLFDWFEHTSERFDVAFSSYGSVGWLCDLGRWATGVRQVLRPGGRLVLVEFHPIVWSLRADGLRGDPYFIDAPITERAGVGDYVNAALAPSGFEPQPIFENPVPAVSFQWTLADILQAVIDAGLQITHVREYPHANGCEPFEGMRALAGRRYVMPADMPSMPLMLGLAAIRPVR
ncbi:MAG: class I SAM-dependent methyltransferase [Deltaproteobacteria bacterium]|nr:class I SAM-dependent methyltransferase [Deltaproteobacteria bacterium]